MHQDKCSSFQSMLFFKRTKSAFHIEPTMFELRLQHVYVQTWEKSDLFLKSDPQDGRSALISVSHQDKCLASHQKLQFFSVEFACICGISPSFLSQTKNMHDRLINYAKVSLRQRASVVVCVHLLLQSVQDVPSSHPMTTGGRYHLSTLHEKTRWMFNSNLSDWVCIVTRWALSFNQLQL